MRWTFLLAALLLVVGFVWFVTRDEAADSLLQPELGAEKSADPNETLAYPGHLVSHSSAAETRETIASADTSAAPTATSEHAFHVTGLILDADGRPAHSATVGCFAFGRLLDNGTRAMVPGVGGVTLAQVTTSGRIEFAVPPDGIAKLRLQVSLPEHVTRHINSPQVVAGGSWDLGTITLARGGNLRVSVVDQAGTLVDDDWKVSAHWPAESTLGLRINDSMSVQYDRVAGHALLQDLPRASVAVTAESPRGGKIQRNDVEVIVGRTVDVALVYEGPDPDRTITVKVDTGRFYGLYPGNRDVQLIGPGAKQRYSDDDRGRNERLFTDLPAGLYTAEVELAHFEPWARVGIALGAHVQADLVPASAIELSVVDDLTGTAIEPFEFMFAYGRVDRGDEIEWTVRMRTDAAHPDDVYRLPDVAGRIVVRADGYGPSNLVLDDLRAGEVRPISVRLQRTRELRGRVVHADGISPVANAIVHLRASGEPSEYLPPGRRVGTRPRADGTLRTNPVHNLYTDEAGRFQMELIAGTHAVHAWAGPELLTVIDPLTIPPGGHDEELLIVMPASGSLFAKLVGGDPADIAGLHVRIFRVPVDATGPRSTDASVESDGSFRAGPLPPGIFKLLLQSESQSVEDSLRASFRPAGTSIEIGQVTITGDGETQAEFDLADRWPARLRFELNSTDRATDGFSLVLESSSPSGGSPALNTNADGVAELRGISPGEYKLYLRPRFLGWNVSLGALHVTPGQDIRLNHELVMIQSRAQLIDADTGDPLADGEVAMNSRSLMPSSFKADANGWIEFELPVGEFELQSRNIRPTRIATLRVTLAGADPQRLELVAK